MRKLNILSIAALAAALIAIPAAAPAAEPDGAPRKATVRFESTMGVPPLGYSLLCPAGFANCTTSGAIDLTTKAEVPTTYSKRIGATYGLAPLAYSQTSGSVEMRFSCEGEPDPFVSHIEVGSTRPGELEIASVKAVPGTNSLAVALNPGGDSGEEFSQEVVRRSDGGCGTPTREITPAMGTWYFNFYGAHKEAQQPATNDLELQGLAYDGAAYTKTYERFVNVSNGLNTYPLFERTRIEVEPEFCAGAPYRIKSATSEGRSLGLGPSFYPGQVVHGTKKTKIRLGDDSAIELEQGGQFAIEECETGQTKIALTESIGKFWTHVKKALGGGNKKFEVTTERAVAGVRGTIFAIKYDKEKELTKLWVKEGSVSFRGRNGAKGKVIVDAGQIAVQRGKRSPKIVKR